MNVETIQQNDQILGYTLTRKIGSGGYGDVWEAEAPGGLKKAVKIVYGYSDEKRAQSELKALDRIKGARHPFLCSLERIEIHNSRLIIISELADKSLADLVNEYSERDEQGIPRDELIGYMRETADGLDYLNSEFGLQHLDIKPENILLVSGHAKVADFGLVKDLRDASQSLMTGMTPAYAAPELFDGRPGAASDQYSLATVYQEMLTLVRPFPGTTPAQLAAQHMHGKPDLRSLPISDQAVVAKALSKEPADRYNSCTQFVEQLSNRKSRKRVIKSRASIRAKVETGSETVIFEGGSNERQDSKLHTEIFSDSRLTFNKVEIVFKDPPACDSANTKFRPTIVIGIGQSANSVAQKIKSRLVTRHGSLESIPSMKLICIDSDQNALAQMSIGRGESQIRTSETLAIPLRRSDQYRQKKNLDLSWISRRWIYNVPRSLQTEGLRPLGRLAFVDHFDAICQKISSSIETAIQAENLATSCETLGLDPAEDMCPRVILLANVAGGLGSGMLNDMAYTVRLMLAEQGINDNEIIGMLMFGNESIGREPGLATANAYAYMTELRHFADGGYPGDKRLGIPEFDEDLPFDHAYAIRLKSENANLEISELDKMAEYICLSTTSSCGDFFETARQQDEENEEFGFRSFGVSVCGPGLTVRGQEAVNRLSKSLIEEWTSAPIADEEAFNEFFNGCVDEFKLKLTPSSMASLKIVTELEEWRQAQQDFEAAKQLISADGPLNFNQLTSHFDNILGAPYWRKDMQEVETLLLDAAETEISTECQIQGDQLSSKILQLLNGQTVRFNGVLDAIARFQQTVATEHESVMSGLNAFGGQLREFKEKLDEIQNSKNSSDQPENDEASLISEYQQIRIQEFALRCCSDRYKVLKSCLGSTEQVVKRFGMQVKAIGDSIDVQEQPKRSARYTPTIQQMLVESVDEGREQLIADVERLVLDQIQQQGDFLQVISDSFNWQQTLPELILKASQSALSNVFKKTSIDEVIAKNDIQPAAVKSWLNEQLNAATPSVTDCGGNAMLLLGQPQFASKSAIPEIVEESFDVNLKEINGTTGDIVMCFEADRIMLANLAFSILRDAPEATEIAKRIPTRTDIDWTTLDDLM